MSVIRLVLVNHLPSRVRIGERYRGFPFDLGAQYKSLTFNGTRAMWTDDALNGIVLCVVPKIRILLVLME